jgi:dihydroneopterin aldolase
MTTGEGQYLFITLEQGKTYRCAIKCEDVRQCLCYPNVKSRIKSVRAKVQCAGFERCGGRITYTPAAIRRETGAKGWVATADLSPS